MEPDFTPRLHGGRATVLSGHGDPLQARRDVNAEMASTLSFPRQASSLEGRRDDSGPAADRLVFLRATPLFESLSDADLHVLASLVREVEIPAGHFVMREGEPGREVFIIKQGEMQVLKGDPNRGSLHEIARLGAGASVGELALLDDEPRSASVRAVGPTTLYAFAPQEIALAGAAATRNSELLRQLSRAIASRLRFTNEVTVRLLRNQVAMARFLTFVVFGLSIYAFALSVMTRYAAQAASNTLVTVSLMLVLTGAVLSMIRRFHYPMTFYGLTRANWRRSVGESLGATLVLCVLVVVLKWIVLRAGLSPGHTLFEPYAAINRTGVAGSSVLTLWAAMAVLYALHAPFQEFVVRGCLQGALDEFLSGTNRQAVAIIGSNLIFSSFHLHLSMGFALLTLLPGLLWGWLYARQRTLVGVALSHALTGLWAVFVVGIEGVLL